MSDPAAPADPAALLAVLGQPDFDDECVRAWLDAAHIGFPELIHGQEPPRCVPAGAARSWAVYHPPYR